VVWSSSAGPAARRGTLACTRTTRIRRRVRTCALLALIGMIRLARAVRARRWRMLLLAGTVLTAAGIVLPDGVIFIAGMLVLLRGVAVTLGVSEPRRPDFFGFGTRRYPGSPGQNRT
jgi:hypothetical protein